MMINTKIEKLKVVNVLSLNRFVYEYARAHIFCSKVMISGLFSIQFPNTSLNIIKRKVGNIFQVYYRLGIAIKYGKNTVKIIDLERLKNFDPEELSELSIHDVRRAEFDKKLIELLANKKLLVLN